LRIACASLTVPETVSNISVLWPIWAVWVCLEVWGWPLVWRWVWNIPGLVFGVPAVIAEPVPGLAAGLGAMILGLIDDMRDVRARYKLLGQLGLATAFSYFVARFGYLHVPGIAPVPLGLLSVPLTVFFIVAVVNGFNMVDGSDGLATVCAATGSLMLAAAAWQQGQTGLALLGLLITAASVGFLFWNLPPARIYLGDAGSQGLGMLLACAVVTLGAKPGRYYPRLDDAIDPFNYRIVVAMLLVGFPALEVTLTVVRRAMQGRSLGRGDQGHMHHRLLRVGAPKLLVVIAAGAFSLLTGGMALAFLAQMKGLAAVLALVLTGSLGAGIVLLGYLRLFQRNWLDERRPHFAIARHFVSLQLLKLGLANTLHETLLIVMQTCREMGVEYCRAAIRPKEPLALGWSWNWRRDTNVADVAKGLVERTKSEDRKAQMVWALDAQGDEPELEMEQRVLMAEFMREALHHLQVLQGLPPDPDAPPELANLEPGMRVHQLRNRLRK
jgi:UDP-GlcNAc:undecaprenyl-phosphate GlcNAc-1-phosphate transferase